VGNLFWWPTIAVVNDLVGNDKLRCPPYAIESELTEF